MKELNFQNFVFGYEPYPLGVARPFIDADYYRQLVDGFPPIDLFAQFPDQNSDKRALSELYNPHVYHRFIRETPVYLKLYNYVKSPEFVHDVLNCFQKNFIELRLDKEKISTSRMPLKGPMFHRLDRAIRRLRGNKRLRPRFEFSALDSNGGNLRPHTDAPQKIITLVVSILKEGEWNPAWRGGTDILKPKDVRRNYNFYNNYLNFDEVETIRTVEYVPNQCILFLKTFNSLHAVAPIQNKGGSVWRRTLTINIERA